MSNFANGKYLTYFCRYSIKPQLQNENILTVNNFQLPDNLWQSSESEA